MLGRFTTRADERCLVPKRKAAATSAWACAELAVNKPYQRHRGLLRAGPRRATRLQRLQKNICPTNQETHRTDSVMGQPMSALGLACVKTHTFAKCRNQGIEHSGVQYLRLSNMQFLQNVCTSAPSAGVLTQPGSKADNRLTSRSRGGPLCPQKRTS